MTASEDSSSCDKSSVDTTTAKPSRNVRFSLRKKRSYADRNIEPSRVNLSSYNSDFLSGLFADVAKANVLKELSIELPSSSSSNPSSTPITEACTPSLSSHLVPDSMGSPRPEKKSRLSYQASFCRSRASCMNLLAIKNQSNLSNLSPKGINEISKLEKDVTKTKKQDSLAYQLDCLEQDSTQEQPHSTGAIALPATVSVSPTNNKKIKKDVAALAFPNLPSTISDSSCESNNVTSTGLTRERCLVLHGPAPEMAAASSSGSKDSFGWFVDLDDNEENDAEDHHTATTSQETACPSDLAFQAPTAPKRANNNVQEEMEQAYAADTIDSVLGDLF